MDDIQGNPLTNHKLPFSTQMIPEIVAPKALTLFAFCFWNGKY